jgi:hypothetical protein
MSILEFSRPPAGFSRSFAPASQILEKDVEANRIEAGPKLK